MAQKGRNAGNGNPKIDNKKLSQLLNYTDYGNTHFIARALQTRGGAGFLSFSSAQSHNANEKTEFL